MMIRRKNRPALAPLEFVMALPFLVILTGIIFTVTRASLLKGQAIEAARNQAWRSRFSGGGGALGFSGSAGAQVLGALAEKSPTSGLQGGAGDKAHGRVQYLAPPNQYFYFGPLSAHASHAVFSDPWDHETFRFDPPGAPAFDHRFAVFGVTGVTGDLFSNILNAVQAPLGAQEAFQQVQQAVNTIRQKIEELNSKIQTLENQLDRLTTQLDKALAASNNALARELRREIDRIRNMLREMREARQKLQQGLNLIP